MKESGLSLLELLLALSLSLMLLLVLSSVYLSLEREGRRQGDLIHLHDNAQAALHILRSEIQAAGFIGCPRLAPGFPWINSSPFDLRFDNKLILEQAASTRMRVWHRSSESSVLVSPMRDLNDLQVSTNLKFKSGDWLIISDCWQAEVFKVAGVRRHGQVQIIETGADLHHWYGPGAELGLLEMNRYYVDGKGLYLNSLQYPKLLLVEGVKNLQVSGEYGFSLRIDLAQGEWRRSEYSFAYLRNS